MVDREPEVAGVGRGESRGARTVPAGRRTIGRIAPGRGSHVRPGYRRLDHTGPPRGQQATRERRHGRRLGLLSRGPPHDHPHQAAGKHVGALCRQAGEPLAAATAHRLGGGPEDHGAPTPYRPGRSAQERARPRLGSLCDQIWVSRNRERDGAADADSDPAGVRWRMDDAAGRHGALARDGRLSRGRSPLPLARARTQPARPAAALCQLPGARGSPRTAAAATGRLGHVLFRDHIQPDQEAQDRHPALPRRSGGAGRGPRVPPQEVAGWLVTTLDARLRLMDGYIEWHWPSDRVVGGGGTPDRRAHRDLVIMLATEIYRRERGHHRRPRTPWSGPISRACPATDRPSWPMGRRRQSSSGFGRLGPSEPRCGSGPPAAAQRSRSRLRCLSSPCAPFSADRAYLDQGPLRAVGSCLFDIPTLKTAASRPRPAFAERLRRPSRILQRPLANLPSRHRDRFFHARRKDTVQHVGGRVGELESVVEFAVRQESGIAGDVGPWKFEAEAAIELGSKWRGLAVTHWESLSGRQEIAKPLQIQAHSRKSCARITGSSGKSGFKTFVPGTTSIEVPRWTSMMPDLTTHEDGATIYVGDASTAGSRDRLSLSRALIPSTTTWSQPGSRA